MKKKCFLSFILVLLLTGCTFTKLEDASYETLINESLFTVNNIYNTNRIGYRYYLPRNFNIKYDRDYNEVFVSKDYRYYLYVDIVSYYNKSSFNFEEKDDVYYSKYLENDGHTGYIEITKLEDYFLIELMYNYSKIEVLTKENDIKDAIINASNILSSIKYNDLVIDNFVGENKLNFEETTYDIFKPKNAVSNKTFLDYQEEYEVEYDTTVEDSDVIK